MAVRHSITGYNPKNDPSIPKPVREAGPDVIAAHYANAAGIKDHDDLVDAVSIAIAESDSDCTAIVDEPDRSTSFGAWMINSVHKPAPKEITVQKPDMGSYAWFANAAWMVKLSNGGKNWNAWSTWPTQAGANRAAAEAAVNTYTALAGGQPGVNKGGMTPTIKDTGTAVDEGIPGVSEVGNAGVSAVSNTIEGVSHLAGVLTDPKLWRRVGMGAGAVLIITAATLVLIIPLARKAHP